MRHPSFDVVEQTPPAGALARRGFASGAARCALGCALGPALSAVALPVWAQKPADSTEGSVQAWLKKTRQASTSRSFLGTFVVMADGAAVSSRIAHYVAGRDSFERVESLDGPARSAYRHNDVVHTVWPQARVVVVEQRATSTSFPALPAAGPGVDQWYRVASVSAGRVAGREATVISIAAIDPSLRLGHKLWLDRQTQLLLRADVLGARGEILESAAFTDVTIGVRPQPAMVLNGMATRTAPWRSVRASMHSTSLSTEGWLWDADVAGLPGFQLVNCVKRPLSSMAAAPDPGATASTQALQAVFSDGLAMVSVFVEPYQTSRHGPEGALQSGATHTLTHRAGSAWITVVGDIPSTAAPRFIVALKRKST